MVTLLEVYNNPAYPWKCPFPKEGNFVYVGSWLYGVSRVFVTAFNKNDRHDHAKYHASGFCQAWADLSPQPLRVSLNPTAVHREGYPVMGVFHPTLELPSTNPLPSFSLISYFLLLVLGD